MNARIGIAVMAAVVLAGTLHAQKPGTVGVGVAISPAVRFVGNEVFTPLTSFTVPMTFGAFRLEPEIGFTRSRLKESDPFGGGGSGEETASLFAFGTGAYYLFGASDAFLTYFGPRFGFARVSETFKLTGQPEESFKRTDAFFGLSLGAEHLFSSHLSLGAEARVTYIKMGEPKFEPSGGGAPDTEASATLTDGLVFVRFYF